jgi:hypothetical protein
MSQKLVSLNPEARGDRGRDREGGPEAMSQAIWDALVNDNARLQDENVRLTRERDEAIKVVEQLKANNRYQKGYTDGQKETETSLVTARAHFRRACEYLEKRTGVHIAEVWMMQIMAEVNIEREQEARKQ